MTSSASGNETKRRETRRELNVRLLVGTLITLTVLAVVGFFWWQFQVGRTAGALLSRAESFEAEEEWMDAATYLHRYLRLNPADEMTQIKLAETYGKWGQQPRQSVQLYYNAVGVAAASQDDKVKAKEPELRRQLAELLLAFRQFVSAQEEAKRLGKEDAQGWYLLASAIYGQWRSETLRRENRQIESADPANDETTQGKWPADSIGAEFGPDGTLDEALERALKLNPEKIDLTTSLARVYRQAEEFLGEKNGEMKAEDRAKKADDLVDQMVAADPKNPDALLARFLYRAQNKLPEADDELTAALNQGAEQIISRWPDHLGILRFAATRSAEGWPQGGSKKEIREHFDGATKLYGHIIAQVDPEHLMSYMALGEIHSLLGESEQAIKMLKKAIAVEETPGDTSLRFQLHDRLVRTLSATLQLDEAAETLDRFESLLADSGQSISRSQLATQTRTITLLRGELHLRQGNLGEGVRLLRQVVLNKATTPQEVRQSFQAWQRLGNINALFSRWVAAAKAYERAANLRPTDAQTRLGAARSWAKALRFDEAIRWYKRALELDDVQTTWLALAYIRLQQQRLLPQSERDWAPFQQELAQARTPKDGKPLIAVWRIPLLEAQYKKARAEEQQKGEEAAQQMLTTLRNLEKGNASSQALMQQLVTLYQELEAPKDADRAIGKFVELAKDSLESYTLPAWTYAGRGEYQRAHKLLETKIVEIDDLDNSDRRQAVIRRRLVRALAGIHLAEGKRKTTRPQVNLQQARAAFENALKWDPKSTQAYERLVAVLCQTKEFDLARHRLREAKKLGVSTARLHALEVIAARGLGESDQAIALARETVKQHPENPLAKVGLGQLLLAADKTDEAERIFREALYLAPSDSRTVDSLFSLFVKSENLDRAKAVLKELEEDKKLTEIQRTLTRARGYEVIGDQDRAKKIFEKAAADHPDDVSVHRRRADFLLHYEPLEAQAALEKIKELQPYSDVDLRNLAVFLAEYSRMTPEAEEDPKHQEEDRLGFQKAIEHLETIVDRSAEFNPPDHSVLAQLYESEFRLQTVRGQPTDRLRAADSQHRSLVTRANREPGHLVAYLNFLLRHVLEAPDDDAPLQVSFEDIDRWLKQLEKASPDSLVAIQLRGRWLLKQDRASEIKPRVEAMFEKAREEVSLGDDPDEAQRRQAQVCVLAANLYMALKQYEPAQDWSERLQELQPERYGVLALCLAQQGQMEKAIELCIRNAKSDDSPQAVLTLISVLTAGKPSPEDFERAEPLLSKAAKDYADNPGLLSAVAGARILQARDKDAVQLYKKVLELKPRDVAALNNLATLLAESKQPDALAEARKYIDQAINSTGERSLLLDTKGMILLQQGDPQQAMACLEAAVAIPKPDPRYYFHLAVAYLRADMRAQAEIAFRQALDQDLEGQLLMHTDKELLAQMKQEFAADSSPKTPSS